MLNVLERYRVGIASHRVAIERPLRAGIVVSLLILLVHWGVVLSFVFPRLGRLHFLRLHYTAGRGVDWVGEWQYIFLFPGVATAAFVINAALAAALARRSRGLGRIVMVATALLQAMLAVGGALAVLLNV